MKDLLLWALGVSSKTPSIDWRSVLAALKPHINGEQLYLETSQGRFVSLADGDRMNVEIVGLAVQPNRDGRTVPEMEEPTRELAVKLAEAIHVEAIPLLRRLPPPDGWYVRIRRPPET